PLGRLGVEAAAPVAEQQVGPAVAVPVEHTRLDPQAPVARPAFVVAVPAGRAFADERPCLFQPGRLRAADVAIPNDAAAVDAQNQVKLAVAIPVGHGGCRVARYLDRFPRRFKAARRAKDWPFTLALIRDEPNLAEHSADDQVHGSCA